MGWILPVIVILSVGAVLAVVHEYWYECDRREQHKRENRDEYDKYIFAIKDVDESHIDHVLKDYEIMNRETDSRGNITEAVGAILITASFLILGNAVAKEVDLGLKYALAAVSMALYVVWFFFLELTTRKLDGMTFSRMRAIEDALTLRFHYKFGIHNYVKYETGKARWLEFRRHCWLVVLILLFAGWASVFYFLNR